MASLPVDIEDTTRSRLRLGLFSSDEKDDHEACDKDFDIWSDFIFSSELHSSDSHVVITYRRLDTRVVETALLKTGSSVFFDGKL